MTPAPVSGRDTGRRTELVLLVWAVVVVMAAYGAVGLGVDGELPAGMVGYGIGLGLLVGVAHAVVRRLAPYADPVLVPVVTLLNGLGLVLIHRVDLAKEAKYGADATASAPAQLMWTAVGIAFFVAMLVFVRDHRTLQRYTYTSMAAGLVLLLLPLAPVLGMELNGARIWISVAGFSIQPGEFAKIVLVVFIAGYLVVKRDVLALASRRVAGIDLPRGRDLGPLLVAWLLSLGVLIFQRDLGTSLLFFGVFVVLLYIATERTSWLLFGTTLFLGGAVLADRLFAHVHKRVEIWLDPFSDPTGDGYQLVQSLYGLASGGILGTGLGRGRPDSVPYAESDFIMSTLGEELGLTGFMAVLVLYGIVVERGLRTAVVVRDPFGKLLTSGLAVILALQVFVVVGGVTRLIPLTGLTTPFLSYGGSSLVANWAIIALLLRVSDAARRPAPPPEAAPDDAQTQVVRL